MASIVAFMHAISSIVIVGVIAFVIKKSYLSSFDNISNKIQLVSYIMIIMIGFFLLAKSIILLFRSNKKTSNTHNEFLKSIPITLAVGLIPCPGALLILLFSLSLNIDAFRNYNAFDNGIWYINRKKI